MQVEQNFMGVQGGYVTYRVNTQTSMPSYPRSGSAVRRRFRDFVVGPVPVCVFFLTEDNLQRTAICRFWVFSLACRACRSAGHAESV